MAGLVAMMGAVSAQSEMKMRRDTLTLHTASGAHRSHAVAFPDWVPPVVLEEAAQLTEDEAVEQLPDGVLPR